MNDSETDIDQSSEIDDDDQPTEERDNDESASHPGDEKRPMPKAAIAIILVGSAIFSLLVSFSLKKPCLDSTWGPPDYVQYRALCYSDLQALYGERHLDTKRFPYVQETSYEYPVVIGLEMWTASNFAHSHETFFLANLPFLILAALLALLGLIGAVGLRWRILWFSLGSPLILYAFHNWDLLAVAPLALAMWAWARRKDGWAGAALGVGAAAKLFPGYAVPALLIARWREPGATRESRIRDSWRILGGAAIGWLVFNLPVMIADASAHDGKPIGWLGVFSFHAKRTPDFGTTWYWIADKLAGQGRPPILQVVPPLAVVTLTAALVSILILATRTGRVRNTDVVGVAVVGLITAALTLFVMIAPAIFADGKACSPVDASAISYGPASCQYKATVDFLSLVLFAVGTVGILILQWRRRRDAWTTAAAITTLFLLTSKVHSPQYAIWLVVFFVVVDVPWYLIVPYFITDAVLMVSGFYWFATSPGLQANSWERVFVWSVYLRALALVGLLIWFTIAGRDLIAGPGAMRSADDGTIDSPPVADDARDDGQALDGEEISDELVSL